MAPRALAEAADVLRAVGYGLGRILALAPLYVLVVLAVALLVGFAPLVLGLVLVILAVALPAIVVGGVMVGLDVIDERFPDLDDGDEAEPTG